MKKLTKALLFSGVCSLALQSCESRKVVVNREVESQNDGKMLLGPQTASQFLREPYASWYNEEYSNYEIDEPTLSQLRKKKLGSYQLVIFVGTWCEDSHREFPRLMKLLDQLKYPKEKMLIVGVNRKKESPSGEEGLHNIQKVPTFIVKKYGKELGRIIEFPKSGFIEKDLLEILNKQDTSIGDLLKK